MSGGQPARSGRGRLAAGALLVFGALGLAGAGCGGPPDPSSCIEVHAVGPLRYSGEKTFFGSHLGAGIDVDLGGGGYHKLAIRFREGGGHPAPGTYDLSLGDEHDFTTCRYCVMVLENVWGDNVNVLNFQLQGTLILEEADPSRGEYRGRVEGVILKPAVQTPQHHVWTGFQDTAHCIHLPSAELDTFAGVGEPCSSSGDCRNHATQICDPRAAECAEDQCDPEAEDPASAGCAPSDVCVVQSSPYGTGACYPTCVPFSSGACEPGFECASVEYDGSSGVCKLPGEAEVGEECESGSTSTGCEPGAVCQTLSPFWSAQHCRTMCDFFGGSAGCAAEERCALRLYRDKDFKQYCYSARCHRGGTCRPAEELGEQAGIGEPCESDPNTPCAVDGERARGVCDADSGNTCLELCALAAPACPAGQTCEQYFVRDDGDTEAEGVGVCR